MNKKLNFLILTLAMVSLAVLVKYSTLPVISVLPENAKDFWISSEEEQYKYSLIYNICLAFFTSSIFYCLVEVIPEKLKYKRAISLIQREINQLISYLEKIISLIVAVYGLPKELEALTEKDFLLIDGDTRTPSIEISFRQTFYFMNNEKNTGIHGYGTLNELVKTSLYNINKAIVKIRKYEHFYSNDSKLVEIIQNIEDSGFLTAYLVSEKKDTELFLLTGSAQKTQELIKMYSRLKQMRLHSEFSTTTLDSPEETKSYREKREIGAFDTWASEILEIRSKKVSDNPCLIVSSEKYTSDLLATNLEKKLFAGKVYPSQIRGMDLSPVKHIIFLVDSDSYKEMLELHDELSDDINLIILQERTMALYSVKSKFNKAHNILKFKALIQFFNTSLYFYKNEPSKKTIGNIKRQLDTLTNRELSPDETPKI